jgi:dienelactone hydrolase
LPAKNNKETSMTFYRDLGIYSDIVDQARRHGPLFPLASPGPETQAKVREVLGWCDHPEQEVAQDLRVERTWVKDGLCGEELSWSVGYGPRTSAWLLKPEGASGPLPGVLALHDHGGFKWYGKEKIADGPDEPHIPVDGFRQSAYGGRAWANALAKEGFAVLVPDTFLWGSRKFPLAEMETALSGRLPAVAGRYQQEAYGVPDEVAYYNYVTGHHEHVVSKYLNLVGTGLPGVVCFEDRIALNVLRARPDVLPDQVAAMGLSGGGNRAGLLRATATGLKAAVVVGLMSTYEGLLDHSTVTHTWMFFPFAWARHGDWPDLVACHAPAPLLVQYDKDDQLFTMEGMQAAHARLQGHYAAVGHPEAYTGQFYPGPHKFDLPMQAAAFAWLKEQLKS